MSSERPVISCKNVWKIFGDDPEGYLAKMPPDMNFDDMREDGYIAGVQDVSLDVNKGEMLVIMGLSGSGKSTLVRCFSRLHEITSGTIEVAGQDIMSLAEKDLIELRRSKMGMVFQSFGLLPHRSVLDNVAFPLEMRGQDKHTRRERALEVIKLVGLEGREDFFPRELSGGQQQRVGIARSLAIEPDIWFLDEPFSALDPLIRREMQDEFLRLQQLLNKTIVFITHDFRRGPAPCRPYRHHEGRRDRAVRHTRPDRSKTGHRLCAQIHRRRRQGPCGACWWIGRRRSNWYRRSCGCLPKRSENGTYVGR